ncbi:MAG: ABC transporter permease subunit [Lachnospiraceae bacterium]|jgi:ABC-type transport system involved in multi-copper enzyme maturation permease subunit|nr:ABC transporter permease subunit [Lachnospiraceae bacterium]
MIKLIRLEWKKNNILKYIRNAGITTAILLLFMIMMAWELETEETIEMYGKGMLDSSVGLFVHMSYIIFTGVMIAAFIVGAYEKKTMNLMFSYPIKRSKIILAKICAVWIFNFLAMVGSKLVIYFGLILTKSFTGIIAESIPIRELSFWLDIVLGSAAMVSISFIALPIGLKMKSSKTVIVASVIIVCFTQGNIGSATLANNIPFYAILLVVAVVSIYLSVYNIETKDLL